MSPGYFHARLTFREAEDYLRGINRRCRAGYDQARMVTTIIGRLFAKNYTPPTFPWEKEENDPQVKPPTEGEIRQLRADAREWERMMNANLTRRE